MSEYVGRAPATEYGFVKRQRIRFLQSTRVLRMLVRRDLKVRYAGTALGYVWTILEPLAMSLIYWFVYTEIFGVRDVGSNPYVLYLLSGMLPWQWVTGVMFESPRALTSESKLVRSTSIDRRVWVTRVTLSKGIEFLFSIPVLIAFALWYQKVPSVWALVALPAGILLQFAFLQAIGLFLAPICVLVRDVARLTRIAVRMLMYLTPVIYSFTNVPESVRPLMAFNPLTGVFELYRACFWPENFAGWQPVTVSVIFTIVTFILGRIVFGRLIRPVLKEI